MSVSGHWFLVTAGHCISTIEEIQESGYEIENCQLVDSMRTGTVDQMPLPFVYDKSRTFRLSEDLALDFGVIYLSNYYRALLEMNGIKPLSETVWKKQPESVDFYKLLGVPSQLTKEVDSQVVFSTTLHPVERLSEKPEGFRHTDIPQFYGKVYLDDEVTSIEGMSGGPIFAFRRDSDGLRYWLVAIQSRWLPESQSIAACPTDILGGALSNLLSRLEGE